MLYFTAVVLALSALGAAQSSSDASPSQTTSPSATQTGYAGPQASPGFGFVYPKKGSFYLLGELIGDNNTIIYEDLGTWPMIIEIPKEIQNQTVWLSVFHTNNTGKPRMSWYLPPKYQRPSDQYPASNKAWPADYRLANASAELEGPTAVIPGTGYFVMLRSAADPFAYDSLPLTPPDLDNATTFAVSELFEFRDAYKTKKWTDPTRPNGPYGPLPADNAAARTLPSIIPVVTAGAIVLWSLL